MEGPSLPAAVEVGDGRVVLARAEPADRDALVDLYADYPVEQRSMGIPPRGGRDRVEAWVSRLLDRGHNVVARDGDRVVGHAVLSPASADRPELATFVDPDYQNRGLGTRLCAAIVALARDAGHAGVELTVLESNPRARHVYENLGFVVVDDPPSKPWRAMYLSLDDGSTEVDEND